MDERVGRDRAIPDDEPIALAPDWLTPAVEVKERHAVALWHDLRRVAARDERVRGIGGKRGRPSGRGELADEN